MTLVRTTVSLAEQLDINCVVEGVETAEQLDALPAYAGCSSRATSTPDPNPPPKPSNPNTLPKASPRSSLSLRDEGWRLGTADLGRHRCAEAALVDDAGPADGELSGPGPTNESRPISNHDRLCRYLATPPRSR